MRQYDAHSDTMEERFREQPETRPSVVMTSIDSEEVGLKGRHAFVTACAAQAQIALVHLDRVWALEGQPSDTKVWQRRFDEIQVWADLQGAMTAGIILSRLLQPGAVRQRPNLSRSESARRSAERGRELRTLLGVAEDSRLLSLRNVRDPLEHIDEKLDRVVEDPTILSISDLYIAPTIYFSESEPAPGRGADDVVGHRNLRTFLPLQGVLMYGDEHIDLFALETEFHQLLSHVPEARGRLDEGRRSTDRLFGAARPRRFDPGHIAARRKEIERFRAQHDEQIALNMKPIRDPGTIVLAQISDSE